MLISTKTVRRQQDVIEMRYLHGITASQVVQLSPAILISLAACSCCYCLVACGWEKLSKELSGLGGLCDF